MLLLDTGSSFLKLYKSDPAFALVSEIGFGRGLAPQRRTLVVMILAFVVGALDLFIALYWRPA